MDKVDRQERDGSGSSPEEEFIARLATMDVGARARLRRSAGKRLDEARGVLGLFYRALPPGVPPSRQEAYFMIGTLYPLAESGGNHSFGATLHAARTEMNARGLDRRVETLLDADAGQLAFRLRQAVRFAQANRVPVNWTQLLRDVLQWDHPAGFVQRKWAEAYFGNLPAKTRAPGAGQDTPEAPRAG